MRVVPAVVFICVLAAGLVLGGIGVARMDQVGSAALDMLDGTATAAFDTRFEEGISAREGAITAMGLLRYLLFRAGSPGVVIGTDGWLYTREDFESHPGDDQALARRLSFIAATQTRLAAQDTHLIVLLLASKARVVNGPLDRRWSRLARHIRYPYAMTWLRNRDIPVVDSLSVLETVDKPFFRTDTHWTPEGNRAVALGVAAAVDRLEALSGAPSSEFQTVPEGTAPLDGDLVSFVPLGRWFDILMGRESITHYTTSTVRGPPLGLFDTPEIPVTLVGTSFSADPRWNFAGHLREALVLDVLEFASQAVGPFVPMAEYLASAAIREVPPRLVIWEIPERYLTLPGIEVPGL